MTRNHDTMLSPPQCSEYCNTQEGSKEQRPTQSKLKAEWKAQIDPRQPELYQIDNCDKKGNHLNACWDLKGLVLVGDPLLVPGKDIPEVPRDCVPYTYHPMYFQKIKKSFGLWLPVSNVSTLTPPDASGLTIWSTDAGTHKIDGTTLKPLVGSRWKIRSGKARLFFRRDVSSGRLNVDSFEKERLTWRFCFATEAYWVLIKVSSKALAKISHTTHPRPRACPTKLSESLL